MHLRTCEAQTAPQAAQDPVIDEDVMAKLQAARQRVAAEAEKIKLQKRAAAAVQRSEQQPAAAALSGARVASGAHSHRAPVDKAMARQLELQAFKARQQEEENLSRGCSHDYWAKNKTSEMQLTGEHRPLNAAEAAVTNAKPIVRPQWYERDITRWAAPHIQALLSQIQFTVAAVDKLALGPELMADCKILSTQAVQYVVRTTSVSKLLPDETEAAKGLLEGSSAQYIVARGKEKVVFDFKIKLKLEVVIEADEIAKKVLTGSLRFHELTLDELDDETMPTTTSSKCHQREWEPQYDKVCKQSWPTLQQTLREFIVQAKDHWRDIA